MKQLQFLRGLMASTLVAAASMVAAQDVTITSTLDAGDPTAGGTDIDILLAVTANTSATFLVAGTSQQIHYNSSQVTYKESAIAADGWTIVVGPEVASPLAPAFEFARGITTFGDPEATTTPELGIVRFTVAASPVLADFNFSVTDGAGTPVQGIFLDPPNIPVLQALTVGYDNTGLQNLTVADWTMMD